MVASKLNRSLYALMAGILLFLSIISFFVYSTFYWNYDDGYYRFKVNGRSYDLSTPKQRWDLPKELEEISGLSYYNKNVLACVQDEDGKIYLYDLKKKAIQLEEKFGDKGDYEGVEVIGDMTYVLKSNGNVYFFSLTDDGIGEVQKIKTDLSAKNDAEGLGFHDLSDDLLIACKEDPGTKKVDLKKSRSVYRIDLKDRDFKEKPKYVIEGKKFNDFLEKKGLSKKKHKPFKPSGVAVHPKTKQIFLIGTVGKLMVILDPDGDIVDLIPLDPTIFWQPEGICFSPNGDLYISSEGKGEKGYILKF